MPARFEWKSSAGRFRRNTSKSGQPCFALKARNGEPVGRSQVYASSSSCKKGIASVRANGECEVGDDRTWPRLTPCRSTPRA